MAKESEEGVRLTKELRYRILRACGFEPKAARYYRDMKCSDELFIEQVAANLKKGDLETKRHGGVK